MFGLFAVCDRFLTARNRDIASIAEGPCRTKSRYPLEDHIRDVPQASASRCAWARGVEISSPS